ncbi:hypothetical protein [Lentzea sp. NBRC 105346]|uniref:hypothetical protein n=1 Tax=Lentzea sp. NBRC 105346 TaxID=3032205 RepID=UPI002556417B|nr:hypothetical protein [Lentzea sp. NBRC 105346]
MSPIGGMNEVQTTYTRVVRPPVVVIAAMFWVLAALSWPVGRMVVGLSGQVDQLWWVAHLFLTVCVVAGVAWPVVRFLQGSFQARLGLTLVALLFFVLALGFLLASLRDGDLVALHVVRLVLLLGAVGLSFLPVSRGYFRANLH